MRQSALCARCAYQKEKARANGTGGPTRKQAAKTRVGTKDTFLSALIENGGHVMLACRKAGVGRSTVVDWRDDDPEFAAMWEAIQAANIERLEAEVDRRALGFEEQLVYQGHKTGETVTKWSDNLLMFRLKALKPEMYRDGPGVNKAGSQLSDAELDDALQRMMARRNKALKVDDESTSIN